MQHKRQKVQEKELVHTKGQEDDEQKWWEENKQALNVFVNDREYERQRTTERYELWQKIHGHNLAVKFDCITYTAEYKPKRWVPSVESRMFMVDLEICVNSQNMWSMSYFDWTRQKENAVYFLREVCLCPPEMAHAAAQYKAAQTILNASKQTLVDVGKQNLLLPCPVDSWWQQDISSVNY
jgi:hypothetical protein